MTESMRARQGEPRSRQFRTNRYFLQNNGWFFNTREGDIKGPYRTREEAEDIVYRYVDRQRSLDQRRMYS